MCPKCKCAAIEEGERDVNVQIHYDREMHYVDCGRIVTPYCARCFHVIPDPDAQIIIENKVREHLGLLLPGDIMRAWSQEQFIGLRLQDLADRAGIDRVMLERIMTYQTLQSPRIDRKLREALELVPA